MATQSVGTRKDHAQEGLAKRVRANQQQRASKLRTRFDYIVCGAGTSGCVVAARLAGMKTQVLLLEAGGTDETELITNPNHWPMTLGTELDWGFAAEPNPHHAEAACEVILSLDAIHTPKLLMQSASETKLN